MIKAISIQDHIIKTENIIKVVRQYENRHQNACLEIYVKGEIIGFYYANNDDMLKDYYRILNALNDVLWSKEND